MSEFPGGASNGWRACIDHIIRPDSPCPVCELEAVNARTKTLLADLDRLANDKADLFRDRQAILLMMEKLQTDFEELQLEHQSMKKLLVECLDDCSTELYDQIEKSVQVKEPCKDSHIFDLGDDAVCDICGIPKSEIVDMDRYRQEWADRWIQGDDDV